MNDFEKSALATFVGYWLGQKIDQTRFGIWFNNNRTIDRIWRSLIIGILLTGIGLLGYFIVLVIAQLSN
jgi:hypothetical protein